MTLAVVPVFVRSDEDVDVTIRTLRTLREVEPGLETLVVDDGSPLRAGVERIRDEAIPLGLRVFEAGTNSGFAAAVNVGLREALERRIDAVLVNADMEFFEPWLDKALATTDSQGRPAAVVGGLLLYPNGLIQSAGTFCSFLNRFFDHRFRFGPGPLPEAQIPFVCPVTAALQLIRHECLDRVGLYDDENFRMGYEDVDYCLRVFETGLECVYNPAVRAIHHESMFRGQASDTLDEWHRTSMIRLMEKHEQTELERYVPVVM